MFSLRRSLIFISLAALTGCSGLPERSPMNAELQEVAAVPDIPRARSWADARPEYYDVWMSISKEDIRKRYPESFG